MARTWSLTIFVFSKKIQAKQDVTCLILESQALVHNDGPVELHTIKRNVKILSISLSEYFFEAPMAG
jgi:hypothetical protein